MGSRWHSPAVATSATDGARPLVKSAPARAGCSDVRLVGQPMTARIIDGKAIAAEIRSEVADAARLLTERGQAPGLATVLVGEDPASKVYVAAKRRACADAGIVAWDHDLP